jgi:crotonobetainyl-CoA:carnitine CoA-transferase CaiB-like acyl-CoA transferase
MLPGTDGAAQAAGGIASAFAQPGQPLRTGQVSVADETAGMTSFAAAMAGLYCARMTGVGQKIDISLLGGQIRLMGFTMTRTVMLPPQPEAAGGQTRIVPGAVPNFNASFNDKDGKPFMFQVVGEEAWTKGMTAAGLMPKLKEIGAEKLGDVASSREKQVVFLDTMNKLFASDSRDKWVKALREADIICAPINTLRDAAQDPDVLANNYVIEVEHPKYGKIHEVGYPWEFSETPAKVGVAPELGEHNMQILKGLGYTDAQIEELKNKKAI